MRHAVSNQRTACRTSSRCGQVTPRRCGVHKLRSLAVRAAAKAPSKADVVIVGAGLAGLACAKALRQEGVNPIILEASDGVGGRVRTDVVDGFLLDRGFQIFLTAYPEAHTVLDYEKLDLKAFYAGAKVWYDGKFHIVADPARHFTDGLLSLTNPVGSVLDKILVGVYRAKSLLKSNESIMEEKETTIAEALKAEGFSPAIISRFFRPFLGGIFFNTQLTTSSRLFAFVMRMLALGQNCLPAGGIGAVATQLADGLPRDSIITGCKVDKVEPGRIQLAGGGEVAVSRGVVVAVEGPEAVRLLGSALKAAPSTPAPGVGTCCLYFKASRPPLPGPMLYLNGEDDGGIVNNCCFPSTVAPSYAPPGQTLVSVSTVGIHSDLDDSSLEAAVKKQLGTWFGTGEVAAWQLLKIYRIPFAQPSQVPPTNFSRPVALGQGLFVCGDHRDSATFDGALRSGKRAADAVLALTKASPTATAATPSPVKV